MSKDNSVTELGDEAWGSSRGGYGGAERVRRFMRTTDRDQGGAVSGRRGGGVRVWLASATERHAQKRDDLVFILAELAPQVRKLPGRSGIEVANYMDMIRLEIMDKLAGGD